MRDSETFFQSRLEQIRAEGRYRTFADLKRRVGAYVQAINYPTVPRGTERLRLAPTPLHSDPDILWLVNAMQGIWDRPKLAPAA
jgi:7-keto-8-aminopelargonate synthetase-like enzyme